MSTLEGESAVPFALRRLLSSAARRSMTRWSSWSRRVIPLSPTERQQDFLQPVLVELAGSAVASAGVDVDEVVGDGLLEL